MTLVEFLTARLSEDEQVAKAATVGPWQVVNVTDYGSATVDGPDALQDGGYDDATKTRRQVMRPQKVISPDVDYGPTVRLGNAAHIARHDPARVLREVEAKRRIMARHSVGTESFGPNMCDGCGEGYGGGYVTVDQCPELHDLASAYAGHADYQEAWRSREECPTRLRQ